MLESVGITPVGPPPPSRPDLCTNRVGALRGSGLFGSVSNENHAAMTMRKICRSADGADLAPHVQ
jgi:hypothetical protein